MVHRVPDSPEPGPATDGAATVTRYLDAVLRRASVPMETEPFEPDWQDRPRSHKVYRGAPGFPLPERVPQPPLELGEVLLDRRPGRRPDGEAVFTLPLLAGMLRHSYGWLSRRLQIDPNPGRRGQAAYSNAEWARGSAAGGGLYPCELYWVCGRGGGPLPGVYHYEQPTHSLRRVATAPLSSQVRAASGLGADTAEQFLLVTTRWWQNAFKYGEFSYHCVTMDLGCLLRTWQTWAAACGIELRPLLCHDEPRLDHLLGLDPGTESVLAVVPLPWRRPADDVPEEGAHDGPGLRPAPPRPPAVTADVAERSSTVRRFPAAEAAHLAAVHDLRPLPAPGTLAEAARVTPARTGPGTRGTSGTPGRPDSLAATVPLPEPAPLSGGVAAALTDRRSSFGRFCAHRPLGTEELSALLSAAAAGRRLGTGQAPLTRAAVFVQHVAGVPAGPYLHDPAAHALVPLPGPAPHPFLQRAYTLTNYNLEQAAVALFVLARPHAVIAAAGPRGYRLLNAEAGAVAQAVYLAAAALGTGCGAALGFDYEAVHTALAPAVGTGTWPLLLLMAGHERPGRARFDAPVTPRSPSPRTEGTDL
ncbi:nitroreductase family protein [Streptomyces sp. NPDC006784]|uniref:nitroreductase family protein n=1 Tax=Streptomyces sp. NPDC006784 TaxID=3364764 RepID=UPI0036761F93